MIGNHSQRMLPYEDPQPAAARANAPQQGLLLVLWRRRWIVLSFTVAALAVAIAYLQRATPIYSSTSRIYVEQTGPRILTDSLASGITSPNYLFTQAEVIKSPPVLNEALETADGKRMKTLAGSANHVGTLKSLLDVEVGKNDDILTVSVNSAYPEEASVLVNSVVDAFISYHSKRQRSTAAEVLKILRKDKDKNDALLEQKLKEMLDFKQANGALSLQYDRGNVIVQRLARLSDVLSEAQLQTLEAKAAYEAEASMAKDPAQLRQLVETLRAKGVFVAVDRLDGDLRTEISRQELQFVLASAKYGADHSSVQTIQLILQQLKQRLAEQEARLAAQEREFVKLHLGTMYQAYVTDKQKEEELAKAFEIQQKQALDLNSTAAQFTKLEMELNRITSYCNTLDDRIKSINVSEDVGAMNISVLEVGRPADGPSKPDRARAMLMALILGLILGLASALARDWMDQRLRSAEEIRVALDLPVLGVVPHISGAFQASVRGQKVHLEPMSDVAEAYRTVRTAIYFGGSEGQAKTLLVTSPAPGDGKTTSASNLAIAMAQAGQRVLIVDADFRKPMQHRVFEVTDSKGLSSVLIGKATLAEAIRRTAIEGLEVLPCGPIPPNPAEILNSQGFADLLKQLGEKYDHVVIDSPPVVPVTDARILGALCDATLLVLRAEKSTRKISLHAVESLLSVGSQIFGVVVNDVYRGKGRYGYYGGYGYYRYGYGHGNGENGGGPNGNGNHVSESVGRPLLTNRHGTLEQDE